MTAEGLSLPSLSEKPSPVVRVTATPPMVTVSLAWTLNVPAAALLIVSVQVSTHDPSGCCVGPASGVTVPTVPGAPPGKVTVGVANVVARSRPGRPSP